MMRWRPSILFILIMAFALAEIGFLTYWRSQIDPHRLPFVFLSVQILIGILPLLFYTSQKHPVSPTVSNLIENLLSRFLTFRIPAFTPLSISKGVLLWSKGSLVGSILAILGLVYSYHLLSPLFQANPINPTQSDIIPLIQKMTRRALAFQFPYAPFMDFGYAQFPTAYIMSPTYLPAQWMPFIVAEKFRFDPRLLSFAVFAGAYGLFILKIIRQKSFILFQILLSLLPIYALHQIYQYEKGILTMTVEMLIMAYYWLLAMSLVGSSRLFQIGAILLCLMSRYALVFWLPVLAFMVWQKEGERAAWRLAAGLLLGSGLLYGSFLVVDPTIFARAQAAYDIAMIGEWGTSDRPGHVYSGLGFALYFFERSPDLVANMALLKKTLLVLSASVSLLLIGIWRKYQRHGHFGLFALCSLKIYLALFYAFLPTPYPYLFVTPLVVSWVVLYQISSLNR